MTQLLGKCKCGKEYYSAQGSKCHKNSNCPNCQVGIDIADMIGDGGIQKKKKASYCEKKGRHKWVQHTKKERMCRVCRETSRL